jgi:uncharacterized protein
MQALVTERCRGALRSGEVVAGALLGSAEGAGEAPLVFALAPIRETPLRFELVLSKLVVGSALVLATGCFVYTEDLLVDGAGGAAGQGGAATGGAAGMGGAGGGACTGDCTHLLISEIVLTPTRAELVEIYNPGAEAVDLSTVYLADFNEYYTVTQGNPTVGMTDFVVSFPAGTTLPPGQRFAIAVAPSADFATEYGQPPNIDLAAMSGEAFPESGLANAGEMIILFEWDGASGLVEDLDYVLWGNRDEAVDKSGIDTYEPDTPAADQSITPAPGSGMALHRCDIDEGNETKSGGNGLRGHDETSENLSATFAIGPPTPKASPPAGTCP